MSDDKPEPNPEDELGELDGAAEPTVERELEQMAAALIEHDDLGGDADDDGDSESDGAEDDPPRARLGFAEMAKIIGLFFVVGLFAVGGLFALKNWRKHPPPEATAQISAKLELAAGEVLLVENSSSQRLLSGTPLPAGARVETAAGARALIRLSDGSRVFLRDETTIVLGVDAPDGVTLEAGELWLETPPLDRDRKPSVHSLGRTTVVLSDGGASLGLGEDGSASVYVAEGVASVSSEAGRSDVRSGERATVGADGGKPVVDAVAFWDDWTGGMADRRAGGRIGGGSGALYAVDDTAPAGTASLPLSISRQTVDVAIEGGLAETRVDQRFFNPSDRDVEGWYWFTIPEGAMLVGFELETDGELVKGEIVERKQAAATYAAAKVSDDNPALLEWIDERTVRARIFPVPALGERRIVVRYQQLLSETGGKLHYSYPLAPANDREAPTIEEFALAVELRGDLADHYAVSTLGEATVSTDNRLVSMRRSGFTPRADFELELTRIDDEPIAPLRLSEYQADRDHARFVMLRWLPDIDFASLPTPRADIVVVVDTSAFGDDAEHQSRVAVAEALLRSLSSDDRFAVVAADLNAEVLYPETGLESATNESIDAALEALTSHRHGGATDLGGIFERALSRVHEGEQPAIVYIGDGLATSGERGSEALAERLRRALSGSRARLFTVGVGPAVDERLLARLARVGGGESLRVESPEQAVVRALELSGAIKTPTLTDLEVVTEQGLALTTLLDDPFSNATGKLARGQELVMLARTHGELPKRLDVRFRVGGELQTRTYDVSHTEGAIDFVVPKLWARARIERLLGDGRGPSAVRGKVLALGLEYGLMTPFTSFLALDSEWAYSRQGIERRSRPWERQLLGQVLPHEREVETTPLRDPTAGELLLGALTAPMGCVAAPDEDVAAQRRLPENTATIDASKSEDTPASARDEADQRGLEGRAEPTEAVDQMEAEEEAPMANASPQPALMPTEPEPDPSADFERAAGFAEHAPGKSRPKPTAKRRKGGGGDKIALGGDFDDPLGDVLNGDGAGSFGSGGGKQGLIAGQTAKDAKLEAKSGNAGRPADGYAEFFDGDELVRLPKPILGDGVRARPTTVSPVARHHKAPCSDASSRPLSQRKILWAQQLDRAADMTGRLRAYEQAASTCELANWRQQRVLLHMLQETVQTEAELELLVAHFWDDAEAKAFMVRALQRRLVDKQLIAALERVLFGGVDLDAFERAVAAAPTDAEALELVQQALETYRDMPAGERLRLDLIHLDLLFALDRVDEAIAAGRKLRELGLMTPALAERLGELLVANGEMDEAKRVYSEIVEYDPSSPDTRRLLGDIFLRHGWYQEAYRQYGDLVALSGAASDRIRLARAAAGAGRVDEGLRVLRQVTIGEGRPGVEDPRRWARMHAAVLLAELLASDDAAPRDKLTRELKRLQLFDAPTTWTFLVWRDLEHPLTLGPATLADDATEAERDAAIEAALRVRGGVSAGDTGLWAVQRGSLDELVARHRGDVPHRAAPFVRVELRWDGETFTVERSVGEVPAATPREDPKPNPEDDPEDDPEDAPTGSNGE